MSNTFFRFEFKYPILARDIKALEWDISRMGMREDMNGIAYPVSSLYFDTPELSDYNDKSGGFLKRRKIRARTYRGCEELSLKGDESKVWLEIKDKYNMFVMKRRVALSAEEWLYFSKRFRIGQELYSRLDLKEKRYLTNSGFMFYAQTEGRI